MSFGSFVVMAPGAVRLVEIVWCFVAIKFACVEF